MSSIVYVDGVTPGDAAHFNNLQQKVEKGQVNGYPDLDSSGKVPLAQLPPVGADLVYQGDFPAGTPYTDGEIVVYNGIAYMCVTPTSAAPTPWPGGPPPTPAYPKPSYGTTLPVGPVDGQEAILVDSVTNPVYVWRFRYNAQSTSPYKWEFIGGVPWPIYLGGYNSITADSTWRNYGFGMLAPRAGDYRIVYSASVYQTTTATGSVYGGIALGSGSIAPVTGGSALQVQPTTAAQIVQVAMNPYVVNVLAGQGIYEILNATTGMVVQMGNRMLSIVPFRVA